MNICEQILRALEYMQVNYKIIHRDLSPHNIMIDKSGTLKILDFGLSFVNEHTLPTTDLKTFGKVKYCDPELFKGGSYSHKSDLHSLGIILYELCLGEKLFKGNTDSEIFIKVQDFKISHERLILLGYHKNIFDLLNKLTLSNSKNGFVDAGDALKNLSHFDNKRNDLLIEIKHLLNASAGDRTKTIYIEPVKKNKSYQKIISLLISFTVVTVFSYLYIHREKQFKISVEIKDSNYELKNVNKPGEVGSELGYYLNSYACLSFIQNAFSLTSLVVTKDVKKIFEAKGITTSPMSMVISIINNHTNNLEIIYSLNKMCNHIKQYKIVTDMNESIQQNLTTVNLKSNHSYEDLRQMLMKTVNYSDEKYLSFLNSFDALLPANNKIKLQDQLSKMNITDLTKSTGYELIGVPVEIFPENINQCSFLLDSYWSKQVGDIRNSIKYFNDTSIILYPFPLAAEIKVANKEGILFNEQKTMDQSVPHPIFQCNSVNNKLS